MLRHQKIVQELQQKMRARFANEDKEMVSLGYSKKHSHTLRSKSYKNESRSLDFSELNQIVQIDPNRRLAIVEPRVTMEQLVRATLRYGLVPPVVPELKKITVGGAIMGAAGESSSHQWGLFSDHLAFEILSGNGDILRASSQENPDLFYATAGSYGSLGALLLAEIPLVEAKKFVHLRYHHFQDPHDAIRYMKKLVEEKEPPTFIDGIIFSKESCVIIEGEQTNEKGDLPQFSLEPIHAEWYYQHVQKIAEKRLSSPYEEVMPLQDYLFRYDQGAFWLGTYLSMRLIFLDLCECIFKLWKSPQNYFSQEQILALRVRKGPSFFTRALNRFFFKSSYLLSCFHRKESWLCDRFMIQDFILPENRTIDFFDAAVSSVAIFPIWLCPMKRVQHPSAIFAPHFLTSHDRSSYGIDIGLYGLPIFSHPIKEMTEKLEQTTFEMGGRKVLYSRSYYTPEKFWEIYSREKYEALRAKFAAKGTWHEITQKVLSE